MRLDAIKVKHDARTHPGAFHRCVQTRFNKQPRPTASQMQTRFTFKTRLDAFQPIIASRRVYTTNAFCRNIVGNALKRVSTDDRVQMHFK
jgi:hypothetical protein